MFDTAVFRYAPVELAPDEIRKDIKSYIQGSYFKDPSMCLVDAIHQVSDVQKWWASAASQAHEASFTPAFEKLEETIRESKRILEIQVSPDDGIDAKYSEETWNRAGQFLLRLADIFWEENSTFLPLPSIGPADAGSIDLFWELSNLTLLINVPADAAMNITFYGRRFKESKISGVLEKNDINPLHLTGWLAGAS